MTEVTQAGTPARTKTTIIDSATAKAKYPVRVGYRTASGNATRDCDDAVARSLRGTGLDDWLRIAEENGVRENLEKLIEAGKNVGQIRMALGRLLRTMVSNHDTDPAKFAAPKLPDPPAPKAATAKADPKPEPEEDDGDQGDDGEEEEGEE